MNNRNKKLMIGALLGLCCGSAFGSSEKLTLEVNIPQLNVAEYHSPYLAIWLEDSSRKSTQIAVWYEMKKRNNEGEEWLKDLRQWWRRGGRGLELPYDGVTSATKGPGSHKVNIDLSAGDFAALESGDYKLRIEAVREVGGRENITIPLTLPLDTRLLPLSAKGKSELGHITLNQ